MLLDFEAAGKETNSALSNWFTTSDMTVRADGTGPYGYGRAMFTYTTQRNLAGNEQTVWANFHFNLFGASNGGFIYYLLDVGTIQVGIGISNQNAIQIYVGGSVVTQTANNAIALGAWYFLQVRSYIHPSSGRVDVYLQGTLILSYTGNTRATANSYVNRWGLSRLNSNTVDIANLILYNETGAAPNARTPETRIYADLPTGNGAVSGFTPSAGSNYQNVDEQPNDGDTTYNSAAAAVTDDLYAYPGSTVPASAIVYAVASEVDARKDDAGANDLDCLIRSNGTTYPHGSTFGLTTTWQRFRTVWTTDPYTGSAWTVNAANAAEIGVRRKT